MITNKPMEPRIKELWLKALRSGTFPQGRLYLDVDEKYCCLGVLCSIAQAENVVIRETSEYGSAAYYIDPDHSMDSSHQVLPRKVQEWAELDSDFAEVTISEEDFHNLNLEYSSFGDVASWKYDDDDGRDNVVVALTAMNDNGASFEKIADIIEKYL